ncbi:MAG: DUF3604 domain-containing protein [Desulfuromusa sp.]|nr:DUF3604 domain-containing protein [Desulfuromusa sp.]
MKKIIGWSVAILILIGAGTGWFVYKKISSRLPLYTPEVIAKLNKEVKAQNESAFTIPKSRKRVSQPKNSLKNVYFGDLHVHTALSFDSFLVGNRNGLDDAYRFAQGEPLKSLAGEVSQLTVPLDFMAVTDHAESFGLFEGCSDPSATQEQKDFCAQFDTPSFTFFLKLKKDSSKRPSKRPAELCGDDGQFCIEHGKSTWKKVLDAADKYYKPGEFTTFPGYEFSPVFKDGKGSNHRNVIFMNSSVPDKVISAFDEETELGLWKTLENTCKENCDFITIPHNMNQSFGTSYSRVTLDEVHYSESDWALRMRSEPLGEIYQTKNSSECAVGIDTTDEECSYEQFYPLCKDGEKGLCATKGSFARDGLKLGLELEKEIGFNPLRIGFIGSTDTHNATSGDTEEWDWHGKMGIMDTPAKTRLKTYKKFKLKQALHFNPGGLAAVWANENTRESIFDALNNKEAYATSGVRIRLRFFGGWNFDKEILDDQEMVKKAYKNGVPMGSVLKQKEGALTPKFIVWAAKDPVNTNLQKIQMVKIWLENGDTKEKVFDIACSEGLTPVNGTCPDNGATVNLNSCDVSADKGDAEIKVLWEDKDFNPAQSVAYYVRALQNPTCRWSTYDALRLGMTPPEYVPATVKERATSSSIWYEPKTVVAIE